MTTHTAKNIIAKWSDSELSERLLNIADVMQNEKRSRAALFLRSSASRLRTLSIENSLRECCDKLHTETLQDISNHPRNTLARRLARSVLTFVEEMKIEKNRHLTTKRVKNADT